MVTGAPADAAYAMQLYDKYSMTGGHELGTELHCQLGGWAEPLNGPVSSPILAAKDKGNWQELNADEQQAAVGLGWDGQLWDEGGAPAATDVTWQVLSTEQQNLAARLGCKCVHLHFETLFMSW